MKARTIIGIAIILLAGYLIASNIVVGTETIDIGNTQVLNCGLTVSTIELENETIKAETHGIAFNFRDDADMVVVKVETLTGTEYNLIDINNSSVSKELKNSYLNFKGGI